MNVSYTVPLQRAWARARSLLLRPFRLETWLTLGFAAFLSEWTSGGWGQTGLHRNLGWHERAGEWPFGDLLPAAMAGSLVAGLLILGVVVALVLLWVGSRGKFVFLDDVLRGRSAIEEPWKRYAHLGQSLFLWKLVFWLVAGVVIGGVLMGTAGTALLAWLGSRQSIMLAPPIVLGVMLAGLLGLACAFIGLMLDDFVVPLMHRDGIRATEAWRRFLPFLREHLGLFVAYALFVLILWLVMSVIIVALGFATCCVGFLLLALPYVAQVVLLPVYVTFRGLGPEFLAQFGPEWDVISAANPQPAHVVPPPATPGPGTPA